MSRCVRVCACAGRPSRLFLLLPVTAFPSATASFFSPLFLRDCPSRLSVFLRLEGFVLLLATVCVHACESVCKSPPPYSLLRVRKLITVMCPVATLPLFFFLFVSPAFSSFPLSVSVCVCVCVPARTSPRCALFFPFHLLSLSCRAFAFVPSFFLPLVRLQRLAPHRQLSPPSLPLPHPSTCTSPGPRVPYRIFFPFFSFPLSSLFVFSFSWFSSVWYADPVEGVPFIACISERFPFFSLLCCVLPPLVRYAAQLCAVPLDRPPVPPL